LKTLLPDWLILTIWRPLLGEIYPNIRAIVVSFNEDKCLLIRYYLDRKPIEMDYESIEVLATEISSATWRQDLIRKIDVECQFVDTTIRKKDFDYLDGVIYSRREYVS
jgi:hypothetical protein